ncbi:MAG TPA: alpha/beta hydrolase [Candidatus Aminicenantes bacterium]|nr:MAG: Non-heme bromoperoxidase BPO-A2 [Candidatus Aminicenantes bacterium ADurb.Bin147]HNQ81167.1 alpha/beta hydrolase [Candidatus Aminicenantes bacterium]HOF83931.1 alpha/beta hydrolase [Candidatus Aminicenantes bacterium]HOS12246.1 alpha/beta hydrolase [Candidatus Aminicenantes bacterium]HOY97835.1 alpha/beta hydrolase [Candidatus Aminicenantes bacterium]
MSRNNSGRLISAVVCFLGALTACRAAGPAGRTVDVGGHRLYCELHGRGTPAVVIDVGAGESFKDWEAVVAALSPETAVVVYDRAGYGRSQAGPLPRDAKAEAADLEALLRKAEIPGPYVLVGHSLGGLNVQRFAHDFPADVAGLVLLDPPPRGWFAGEAFPGLKRMFRAAAEDLAAQAEAAKKSSDGDERMMASYLEAVASEHAAMFGTTASQVREAAAFGDLPLIVVAAGRPNPAFGEEAGAFQAYWIEENRALSRLSRKGEFILAENSGHRLHRDAPDTVLRAIRKLAGR